MALGTAAALELAVLVKVHIVHPVLGVRVLMAFHVVGQAGLVDPLEVLGRLVVEAGNSVAVGGIGRHRGLVVQLAGFEGDFLLVGAVGIHHRLDLGEALLVVEHVARSVLHGAVHLGVLRHRGRHIGGEAMRPARGLGQPGHVAVLGGEVGLRGLGRPGADEVQLLGVGERLAVLVGQIGQGFLLGTHVVDTGAQLQGDHIAGTHVAVGSHVVPVSRQHAVMLHELGVVGVVGRRQLEDEGLAAMGPRLHVLAIGQIVRIVHVGLAVVLVLAVGTVGLVGVGILVVVGLHAHAHGPTGLHQLLGRQAQVLLLLVLALRVHRRARHRILHRAGVGMAVAVGVLHVEGILIVLVVAEQALEVGGGHRLAQIPQLVLVVEGYLLGQIHREHELRVQQRALLALLAGSPLVADDGVAEGGREPHLVVVLEGAFLGVGGAVLQLGTVGRTGQRQHLIGAQVTLGHHAVGGGIRRLGRRLVLNLEGRPQGGRLQAQPAGGEYAGIHMGGLLARRTVGELLGLGGLGVGAVGGGTALGVHIAVVQVLRRLGRQAVLGAEVILRHVHAQVVGRAGQGHRGAAGAGGAALLGVLAEVAEQMVVLHAVVGLGAGVVVVVGHAPHHLEPVGAVVALPIHIAIVVARAVPVAVVARHAVGAGAVRVQRHVLVAETREHVVVLPLEAVGRASVAVVVGRGAQIAAGTPDVVVPAAVVVHAVHVGGRHGIQAHVALAPVAGAAEAGRGAHGIGVAGDVLVGEGLVAGHGARHIGADALRGARGLLVVG